MPPNNSEEQENQISYIEAEITKASDGSFVAIASTNSVDRHGEIVDNNGWELKAFKKNPVILWAHDHLEPAIGVSKKTWVEGTGKKAKLMIQPLLHDVTEKARAIKQLVEMGVINSLSVGFKPLESPDGVTFTKNELLEVSMVNVPANADAMMMAYKSLKTSGIKDKTMKELGIPIEVIDKVAALEEDIAELRSEVTELKASTTPEVSKDAVKKRLSMLKIIARASDKLLEGEKKNLPKTNRISLVKVVKQATEQIIVEDVKKVR